MLYFLAIALSDRDMFDISRLGSFPMPFIMDVEKASRIIVAGLARNRSRIAFPRLLYWPLWWITCLPTSWTDPIFSRLPAKPSATSL